MAAQLGEAAGYGQLEKSAVRDAGEGIDHRELLQLGDAFLCRGQRGVICERLDRADEDLAVALTDRPYANDDGSRWPLLW